jgi:hypothetical protein
MVFENTGELPDAQMYGGWLMEQEALANRNASHSLPSLLSTLGTAPPLPPPSWKGLNMKTRKLHTGAYWCPNCCVEFDLVAETKLKCDECQGPLASGTLDDYCEAEEDMGDELPRD